MERRQTDKSLPYDVNNGITICEEYTTFRRHNTGFFPQETYSNRIQIECVLFVNKLLAAITTVI